MLTPLDDYLVHQTPYTVDTVGTSDRNFYDRYYFNAHTLDGEALLIVAMGLYPNIGVLDAFATLVVDGKTQHIVRGSRELRSDRMNTTVGPIGVEVLEGLRRIRVWCEPTEHALSFDMTFEGIAFPFEEPHFFRRAGNRVMMDYTRLTQVGRWSGTLRAGDRAWDVTPNAWWGARDHSWGIRPVGDPDPRGAPPADAKLPGFFWLWSPMQFENACLMYTCSEDSDGERWHAAAELIPKGHEPGGAERLDVVRNDIVMTPGTRTFERGAFVVARGDGAELAVRCEPKTTIYMAGAGYAYTGGWRHGQYHGALAVEGETWDLTDKALLPRIAGQTETLCDFTVDGMPELGTGHGIVEFLLLGAYEPYGFRQWSDVAPAK
jgi:hypothetical protein